MLELDGTVMCRVCLECKETSEFYRNSAMALGIEGLCKLCSAKKAKKRRNSGVPVNRSMDQHATERMANNRVIRKFPLSMPNSPMMKGWRERLLATYSSCLACGISERLSVDHVVPLALGGMHAPDNLQVLCVACNARKGNDLKDYRDGRIFQG